MTIVDSPIPETSSNQKSETHLPEAKPRANRLIGLLKIAIALSIFAFLVSGLDREKFVEFWNEPKRWDLLLVAFVWVLGAHLLTYIRWWQLIQSIGVAMPMTTAIRVGFLGTALNLVSFGAIGGDLFKAVVASRSARNKLPELITSVIIDRIVGLIGLILLTAISLETYQYLMRQADVTATLPESIAMLRKICWIASVVSLGGVVALVALGRRLPVAWLSRLPVVGTMAVRMAAAAQLLHNRPALLFGQIVISVFVHLSLTLGFYTTSMTLYDNSPGLLENLVTIPPAFAIAAIPITPGGVMVFEGAVVELMKLFPTPGENYPAALIIILFVYRFLLLLTAAIGGVYYLLGFGRLATSEQKLADDYGH